MIKIFYKEHEPATVFNGKILKAFSLTSRKKQKFLICPFLFVIVFENLTSEKIKGLKGRNWPTSLYMRKITKNLQINYEN